MEEHKAIDYTEQLEGLRSALKELEFLDFLNPNILRNSDSVDAINVIIRCLARSGLSCKRVHLFGKSFLRHIYDEKYTSWDDAITAIANDWNDRIIRDVYLSEYEQLVNAIKQVLGYYRWQSSRSNELHQQIIEMYEGFDREKELERKNDK